MSKKIAMLALMGGVALAACDGNTGPGEPVVTALGCDVDETGEIFNCAMQLQEPAGLLLELEVFTCAAHGNTIYLHEPLDSVLTSDACYDSGRTWEFTGPFDTGTAVAISVVSARLQYSPGVNITGSYPQWIAYFEDGGDHDFDDLVLTVTAEPMN
jgi:hypothetical protein